MQQGSSLHWNFMPKQNVGCNNVVERKDLATLLSAKTFEV